MSLRRTLRQVDYGLVGLVLLISALGVVVLWSASHGPEGINSGYVTRQIRWMAIGLGVMGTVAFVDYHHLETYAKPIFLAHLALLVLVLALGTRSMGAQRWLVMGPLRLQPSELVKIATAIITAKLLAGSASRPPYGLRELAIPALWTAAPVILVILQPDLGTAILVAGIAGAMVLFHGVHRRVLLWCAAALVAAAPVGWGVLHEYQRQRILTFLAPERDPLGAGYHIIQSKIAVGSGQILGKGYLEGTQVHLQFLPERHTDFIFSVLAEEWGFIGSGVILALYALLILWGLDIAAKARDAFGRLLAVGLTSILLFHVVVNVGMVTGLLPVVGVPLPLFSYGGSSIITTYAAVGILLSIRMHRFSHAW